jgi:hypothetical protein
MTQGRTGLQARLLEFSQMRDVTRADGKLDDVQHEAKLGAKICAGNQPQVETATQGRSREF